MKQRHRRSKKPGEPLIHTFAVTHIRLGEANAGKLVALDALAPVYLALCQEYVTLFCTAVQPDKFSPPVFQTPLSERWHPSPFNKRQALPSRGVSTVNRHTR